MKIFYTLCQRKREPIRVTFLVRTPHGLIFHEAVNATNYSPTRPCSPYTSLANYAKSF